MTTQQEHLPSNLNPEFADLDQRELSIDERFDPERIGALATEFLEQGTGTDLKERLGDRQFVVAYIPATSKYADIGKVVESTVFAERFGQTREEVTQTYSKYDKTSDLICVFDAAADVPRAAGMARVTNYDPEVGFIDVEDFIADGSPWNEELVKHYFRPGESYDSDTAWKRLKDKVGVELDFSKSLDVPVHAAMEGYRGQHGGLDGTSMLFFHSCLRYALAHKKENLFAIFDVNPFKNLQQFGEPFDTYPGIPAKEYGGPYPAIPAYCQVEKGMERIRNHDELVGQVFIDGVTLDEIALLPDEYQPELYSNKAVGLSS